MNRDIHRYSKQREDKSNVCLLRIEINLTKDFRASDLFFRWIRGDFDEEHRNDEQADNSRVKRVKCFVQQLIWDNEGRIEQIRQHSVEQFSFDWLGWKMEIWLSESDVDERSVSESFHSFCCRGVFDRFINFDNLTIDEWRGWFSKDHIDRWIIFRRSRRMVYSFNHSFRSYLLWIFLAHECISHIEQNEDRTIWLH